MRMRGDMHCFHEPFGEAWYQGDDALWPRLQSDSPRQPGLTYATVLEKLKSAARDKPVFSKDMPQFTDHLWSLEFFSYFQHSFLIRDPAKVLTSCSRNWPEFLAKEIGFKEQRALYDRLCDVNGMAPPVIDSDDLLANPHGVVEAYCKAMGISYIEDALSWKPGERQEVLWYDTGGVWHETLKNSDGLKAQTPKQVDITTTPGWVQAMYEEFLPHYNYLHQYRIQINDSN